MNYPLPPARYSVQAANLTSSKRGTARAAPHPLTRLRYMVLVGIFVAIVLPMLVRQVTTGIAVTQPTQYMTALGGCIALFLGLFCYRRLHVFPGIAAGGYIVMSLSVTFAALAIAFFLLRIDYSRLQFLSSYVLSLGSYLYLHLRFTARRRLRLGVVPSRSTAMLPAFDHVDWIHLPVTVADNELDVDGIVVDLHSDHDDAWEKRITHFVLDGIPVYHVKQALEQLSGRLEIHHLSENTLGSLNPNDVYLKAKAVADGLIAAILLVILTPFLLITGLIVRLDSPGPALFRQPRVGFRGRTFTVYKLRTMHTAQELAAKADCDRQVAMTEEDDPRITRVGRILRRSRIDELPQLLNVIRGEMSLIGPRPEAVALSRWYEKEISFYHYRHLIKPGITGWAQVNQGHVTGLSDVQEKLHLDFYYVKNFSFWLDVLIAARTIKIMLSGHGAR